MNNTKSFNKIAINEKRVLVHYIKHVLCDDGDMKNIEYPIKSDVKPHKDFFSAFQGLKKYAIGYMELSPFVSSIEQAVLDKHVVTTVNITEDTDTVKIQISMNKYLTNGKCYSVTSPLIDLEDENYADLADFREDYWTLIEEAKEYLSGKNGEEQLSINFEAA